MGKGHVTGRTARGTACWSVDTGPSRHGIDLPSLAPRLILASTIYLPRRALRTRTRPLEGGGCRLGLPAGRRHVDVPVNVVQSAPFRRLVNYWQSLVVDSQAKPVDLVGN